MPIFIRKMCFALIILTLAGCKEVLYSELDQTQANDMVAILDASDIEAERSVAKGGLYSLSVNKEDIAKAVVVLREKGFPKERFAGLGEIFQSEGIMGTPFEQHVRFIHALNEELSGAISSISGVRSAKVLITLPVPKRYEREPAKASASITVHNQPEFDVIANTSKLKRLVSSAVPNLAYEDVTISSFAASEVLMTKRRVAPSRSFETLSVENRNPGSDGGAETAWRTNVMPASANAAAYDDFDMAQAFWGFGLFTLAFAAFCLVMRLTRKKTPAKGAY